MAHQLIGEFLIVMGKLAHYLPTPELRNKAADQLEIWFKGLNLDQ